MISLSVGERKIMNHFVVNLDKVEGFKSLKRLEPLERLQRLEPVR